MERTFLITGASGHLGGGILDHLLRHVPAGQLIAFARDPRKVERFAAQGVPVRQGDLGDPASLERAFAGVHTVLLIPSVNLGPGRVMENRNAIAAAKKAGVQHLLYTGVIHHGETGLGPILSDHQQAEADIAASGIPHTFIRNGLYLDVLPMMLGPAHESGVFHYPATKGITVGLRAELAEATARVLREPALQGGVVELGLPTTTTYAQIADALSRAVGRPVRFADIPFPALREALVGAGLPAAVADAFTDLARALADGVVHAPMNTLTELLGRAPLGVDRFLKEAYAAEQLTA